MTCLSPANVMRSALLGGMRVASDVIGLRPPGDGLARFLSRSINDSLKHLEKIGLGEQAVVADLFREVRTFGPVARLIDNFNLDQGPSSDMEADIYVAENGIELTMLIGTLFMVDPMEIRELLATALQPDTGEADEEVSTDETLEILIVALTCLQLSTGAERLTDHMDDSIAGIRQIGQEIKQLKEDADVRGALRQMQLEEYLRQAFRFKG